MAGAILMISALLAAGAPQQGVASGDVDVKALTALAAKNEPFRPDPIVSASVQSPWTRSANGKMDRLLMTLAVSDHVSHKCYVWKDVEFDRFPGDATPAFVPPPRAAGRPIACSSVGFTPPAIQKAGSGFPKSVAPGSKDEKDLLAAARDQIPFEDEDTIALSIQQPWTPAGSDEKVVAAVAAWDPSDKKCHVWSQVEIVKRHIGGRLELLSEGDDAHRWEIACATLGYTPKPGWKPPKRWQPPTAGDSGSSTSPIVGLVSGGDCRAAISHESSQCDSADCRGLLDRSSSECESADCRARVDHNGSECESADCRAMIARDPSQCESADCRALLERNSASCESAACQAVLSNSTAACP